MFRYNRAQSFNEYALVLALVTLVGLGMQNYLKQGVQSVVKLTADNLATGGNLENTTVAPADAANALLNGVREPGLYTLTMVNPIEVKIDKKSTVDTTTTRDKTVSKDDTKITGKWNVTYYLENTGTFSSLEKQKTAKTSDDSQPMPVASKK